MYVHVQCWPHITATCTCILHIAAIALIPESMYIVILRDPYQNDQYTFQSPPHWGMTTVIHSTTANWCSKLRSNYVATATLHTAHTLHTSCKRIQRLRDVSHKHGGIHCRLLWVWWALWWLSHVFDFTGLTLVRRECFVVLSPTTPQTAKM